MKIKDLNVWLSFSIFNLFGYLEQMKMTYSVTVEPGEETIPVNTVYCLGMNYADHAREMGADVPTEPVVFIKPATSIINGESPILLPTFSNDIHHEIELVVLVDNVPENISVVDAETYILAYGVGLDLTARDIQSIAKKKGLPWTTAKGFDGSAPVSRFLAAKNNLIKPTTMLRLTINGQVKQQDTIGKMLLPVPVIIAHLSKYFTLRRGDLIFTGTPEGVGPLQPGDIVTVELVDIISFTTRVQKS